MFDSLISQVSTEMSEIEIKQLSDTEPYKKEYINGIIKLSDEFKDGGNFDDICDKLKKYIRNEKLLKIIIDDFEDNIKGFQETECIRNLDLDNFKKISKIVFEKAILEVSTLKEIKELTGIDKKEIYCVLKFLKHSIQQIIVQRHSENLFIELNYDMFRMKKDYSSFIFDLIKENKNELIVSVMIENSNLLKNIKDSVSTILDIFKKMIDE